MKDKILFLGVSLLVIGFILYVISNDSHGLIGVTATGQVVAGRTPNPNRGYGTLMMIGGIFVSLIGLLIKEDKNPKKDED